MNVFTTGLRPRNCHKAQVTLGTSESGSYRINPRDDLGSLDVFCDMESNQGGWTVFQKRFDGTVEFFRKWHVYENGFGNSDGEYWLGLKNIRRLLSDGKNWTMRIDLDVFDGRKAYAEYDGFAIGDENSNYRLTVGSYRGNAGDALVSDNPYCRHNGMQFTTLARDNDRWIDDDTLGPGGNCAISHKAGWWFNNCRMAWFDNCRMAYLNGPYNGAIKGMVYKPGDLMSNSRNLR